MRQVFIAIIRLYQLAISPLMGNHCRFYPSCSHYAIEAMETHGMLHGSFLTIKRLSRCHPFCEGGEDPVPEKQTAQVVQKQIIQAKTARTKEPKLTATN